MRSREWVDQLKPSNCLEVAHIADAAFGSALIPEAHFSRYVRALWQFEIYATDLGHRTVQSDQEVLFRAIVDRRWQPANIAAHFVGA